MKNLPPPLHATYSFHSLHWERYSPYLLPWLCLDQPLEKGESTGLAVLALAAAGASSTGSWVALASWVAFASLMALAFASWEAPMFASRGRSIL